MCWLYKYPSGIELSYCSFHLWALGPISHNPSMSVSLCSFISLFCLCLRMESLLAWKCSSPKRPSSTQRPARPFSMTSSSTRLPTAETLPLPAKPLPLTVPTPTPPLSTFQNRPKHPRKPSRPRCPSRPNHPNPPRSIQPLTASPCLEGTPHLAVTPLLFATHRPSVILHLGAIFPPPAIRPPTTLPPSANACPHLLPPRRSFAGPEVDLRPPTQSARARGESARVDTFVHLPPRLISPSHLHRHHPG